MISIKIKFFWLSIITTNCKINYKAQNRQFIKKRRSNIATEFAFSKYVEFIKKQ